MKKIDEKTTRYDGEINLLKILASSIGKYIHIQNNHNLNYSYWVDLFNEKENFTTAEINSGRMETFSMEFLEIYFDYFYGLLMNCEKNIIINGIFKRFFGAISYFENQYQIIFILSIYCYMYYIGYENDVCNDEIKICAQKILKSKEVRNAYQDLQYNIYGVIDNDKIWNKNIYQLLNKMIKQYELCNKYDMFAYSNIEDIILRFYVFVCTSIAYNIDEEIISRCINIDNVMEYLKAVKENFIKDTFQKMYNILFDNQDKNKDIKEEYYSLFTEQLKKQVKDDTISKMNEIYIHFNEEPIIKNIRNNVKNIINKKYKLSNDLKNGELFEIELIDKNYNITKLSDGLLFENVINNVFFKELINYLKENNYLETKSCNANKLKEIEFIKYLKREEYDFIITEHKKIKKIYSHIKKIFNLILINDENIFTVLNSKDLIIKINNVDIEIEPIELELSNYYDRYNDVYIYLDENDINLEFSKEEIKDYLMKKEKRLKIKIEILIKCKKEKIGIIYKEN